LALGLCLFAAAIVAALASPGAGLPTLNAALSQLQNGDAAGAAKSLRRITSFDRRNAAVWRTLGTADMMQEDFTAAIADYSRALQLQADSPRVFYQLGAAYAAKHDSRHAFEFLERAQASHRYDMTEISQDVHLVGLRNDSRFNAFYLRRQTSRSRSSNR
jgi:Flp pilus assembly protein TadD